MSDRVLTDSAGTGENSDARTQLEQDGFSDRVILRVLGKFDLSVDGHSVSLGLTSQRLLTLLAIRAGEGRSGQVLRGHAAGKLWPETRTARAVANLRSAIWRLQQSCPGVVEASFYDLRLASAVSVDICEVSSIAFGLLLPSSDLSTAQLSAAVRCNLYDDIDPDVGDDDWLMAERERFRQLRIHALEALAGKLITAGSHGAAVEAALGAIRADPFRESAYGLLIRAYLAEGSQLEARRQYNAYRDLLRTELGLEPSAEFTALLTIGVPNQSRAEQSPRTARPFGGGPRTVASMR
jgi:DNA-binding SARP family transcriptional activator